MKITIKLSNFLLESIREGICRYALNSVQKHIVITLI